MKIAFVYDWFDTRLGGAERVLEVFHSMYPDAAWHTLHVDYEKVPWAKGWDIRPSFLQKLPLIFRRNRILSLLLMPFAFESFDFREYDVVVSISSGFAKNIITNTNTRHVCYLLTPPRWLWTNQKDEGGKSWFSFFEIKIRNYLKNWDNIGAKRVDEFISISSEVQNRCSNFYGRESLVLQPPFDFDKWNGYLNNLPSPKKNELYEYFLVVGRLEPYKRVSVVLDAFASYKARKNDVHVEKLIVVGTGSEKKKLLEKVRKLGINKNIIWKENLTEEELSVLYARAVALVMPQVEDFGYVACEAISSGCPVVCNQVGGQTDVVKNGENGVYFQSQDAEGIADALEEVVKFRYNHKIYENRHIRGWGRNSFVATLSQKISETI